MYKWPLPFQRMSSVTLSTILVVVDNDPDDRVGAREALAKRGLRDDFCVGENDVWPYDSSWLKKDGCEVLREIRAAPMFKAMPIVS